MRRFISLGCRVALLALGVTSWLAAQAMPGGIPFDIKAGTAATSLKEFATQAHLQLLFDYKAVEKLKTPAVKGQLTPTEALKEMLEGSGFTFHEINDHTIAITRPGASTSSSGMQQEPPSGTEAPKEGKTSPSPGFLLAQVAQGQTSSAAAISDQQSAQSKSEYLQEVIVTAQKRAERLQDVPVPVTALSAESLLSQNQLGLTEYYNNVPGLSIKTDGHGYANLSIRGITTGGYTSPTVGVVFDDVPFGPTVGLGSRTSVPDLDPSDLSQIEVLRGPQGTLYGASSIGGLLKFITVDPSTAGFSGRIQADLNGVSNGEELGYGVRAAINAPLTDNLAMRVSGFDRRDPGYLDNPILHKNGVNQLEAAGGHLAALWTLAEGWSLKVSALYQRTKADAPSDVTLLPGGGDLQQAQPMPLGAYTHTMQLYAATLSGELGSVHLTAISGYGIDKYDSTIDLSIFGFGAPETLYTVDGEEQVGQNQTKKFSQELRLSGSATQTVDWLLGAFYTHEDTPTHDIYYAIDIPTLRVAGLLIDDPYPTTYAEYAAFGDLTVHFSDRFDTQFGARFSENRQAYQEPLTGPGLPLVGYPTPAIQPPVHTKDNSVTYLVTPRFRISPDLMAYARLASGYRPGGPNPTCVLFPTPCTFKPDKTQNYELGVKGDLFNHMFSFDASAYYIDWKDIQLQIADPVTQATFFANGSRAKSQGLELAVQARPFHGFTVSGWIALSDAQLTQSIPTNSFAVGNAGDRLPYSSRFSANLSLEQTFALGGSLNGFVGGTIIYIGDRLDNFPALGQMRNDLPGYAQLNLRTGIMFKTWNINLFANNVADKRGVLAIPPQFYTFPAVDYIPPRTVGLSATTTF